METVERLGVYLGRGGEKKRKNDYWRLCWAVVEDERCGGKEGRKLRDKSGGKKQVWKFEVWWLNYGGDWFVWFLGFILGWRKWEKNGWNMKMLWEFIKKKLKTINRPRNLLSRIWIKFMGKLYLSLL